MSSSVVHTEIAHFSRDAPNWWDESGPFAPLHRLNPARLGYIRAQIEKHFEGTPLLASPLARGEDKGGGALKPFANLTLLDIGCGGGLVCEPMARLGVQVTGIDADLVAIEVAKEHARQSGLNINYKNKAAEDMGEQFDVVLALEIIEHVENPAEFVKNCAKLVKPGGLVIFSTLNRTPKSFALGILAAEYILRIVPRGTHEWKKFIKPSELAKFARAAELQPQDISGLRYHPLSGDFEISKSDIGVNYFLSAQKPKIRD